ncbi:MAG TPA: hypothetical protein VEU06_07280, partial [Micropepsaceae bacterium]|nr:hypothetical protein [Micropepsaceae bacterium]
MPKIATQAMIFALISGAAISAFIVLPSKAASDSHPDFSGFWGRNSFDPEAPDSGPGPLQNIKRLPSGVGDPQALVGDYHSPILKPE